MSKRDLALKALRNEPVERIPVGFWFHFLDDPGGTDGVANPRLVEENLEGHRKFYRDFQPDIVKIMSDSLFVYPNEPFLKAKNAGELREVRSIGEDHPWIEKQVALVRELTSFFRGEVLSFYNIFAPVSTFGFGRRNEPRGADGVLADFIAEDREAVLHALGVAAADLAALARKVIREGGADGIYLSARNIQDPRAGEAEHRELVSPGDIAILEEANRAGEYNILHICGNAGRRNEFSQFSPYPARILNWATAVEGVSLGAGKKLFGNKPVIGGFDNSPQGVLYRGSREEVEAETARIIAEAGKTGIILGADCTIPPDTDLKRLNWVRDKAAALS
jgi:uroporphyrinogen decarboxylase